MTHRPGAFGSLMTEGRSSELVKLPIVGVSQEQQHLS
jgi:hypothetical protein